MIFLQYQIQNSARWKLDRRSNNETSTSEDVERSEAVEFEQR